VTHSERLASVLPAVTAPQRVISIAGTSVAANSEQKAEVTLVSENNPVADQIPATQPEPVAVAQPARAVASNQSKAKPFSAAVQQFYSYEDSLEVMELCKL
jgi:hypothetical protein